MGAALESIYVVAEIKAEVKAAFDVAREEQINEYINDHGKYEGYSGTLYEKPGLVFKPRQATLEDAEQLLIENPKWAEAWAIPYGEGNDWLVGGWCSS